MSKARYPARLAYVAGLLTAHPEVLAVALAGSDSLRLALATRLAALAAATPTAPLAALLREIACSEQETAYTRRMASMALVTAYPPPTDPPPTPAP